MLSIRFCMQAYTILMLISELCSEETEWLNQLQEKLEKSSKSAADAEEISEALDVSLEFVTVYL